MTETSEGGLMGRIRNLLKPRSPSLELSAPEKKHSTIQGANLTVDSSSTAGFIQGNPLGNFMNQSYSSFEMLRTAVEKAGFTMSVPERDDKFAENRAGVGIFQNGRKIGTLSFKATIDLTQGQKTDLDKLLPKGK